MASLLTPLIGLVSDVIDNWKRHDDSPITLIRHDRRLLEELLPLLRQSRECELSVRRTAGANFDLSIFGDCGQNGVVATGSFNAKSARSCDCVGAKERRELAVSFRGFVRFLNGA